MQMNVLSKPQTPTRFPLIGVRKRARPAAAGCAKHSPRAHTTASARTRDARVDWRGWGASTLTGDAGATAYSAATLSTLIETAPMTSARSPDKGIAERTA